MREESSHGSLQMLAALHLGAGPAIHSDDRSSPSMTSVDRGAAMATDEESTGRLSSLNSLPWRQDLFSAADSVTDAMSSLVNEYNAGKFVWTKELRILLTDVSF
jgi:hypothetical protein